MGKLLKLLRVWPKNNRVTYSFHSLSFQPKSRNLLSGWTNEFTQNLNSATGTVSRHSVTSSSWEDPHSPDLQDNRLKYYCYAWAMLSEHGHKTLRIEAQTLYLSMDTILKNEHLKMDITHRLWPRCSVVTYVLYPCLCEVSTQ